MGRVLDYLDKHKATTRLTGEWEGQREQGGEGGQVCHFRTESRPLCTRREKTQVLPGLFDAYISVLAFLGLPPPPPPGN